MTQKQHGLCTRDFRSESSSDLSLASDGYQWVIHDISWNAVTISDIIGNIKRIGHKCVIGVDS